MDKSRVIALISTTYSVDAIGQRIPTETSRNCFCNIQSVSRAEWESAGNRGFKPEWRVTMFAPDYSGEQIVVIDGTRFAVYRTYEKSNEDIELYLERRVGI